MSGGDGKLEVTEPPESGAEPGVEPAEQERARPRPPWPAEWNATLGFAAGVALAAFVFIQLRPDLLFDDTTPNGGDTGAHVWGPNYLRHHVLPHLRLSGWAPDWYAGFPTGHFYFPVPALLIVIADLVLPYNVAFKLVSSAGVIALPAAAYVFARGIKAPWPAPPLFSAAMVLFLFLPKYQNFGGNMVSELQGEYSFALALAFGLAFLGVWARMLDERRSLALPAALLAATVMSHVIVSVFAVGGALVLLLERRPLANFRLAAAVGGVGALLTGIWSLPLLARLGYTTDMGWAKEPVSRLVSRSDAAYSYDFRWAFALGAIALIGAVVVPRRSTLRLVAITTLFGAAYWLAPETRLWNGRLLSFWFVGVSLLAAMGVTELVIAVGKLIEQPRGARTVRTSWVVATAVVVAAAGVMGIAHRSRGFLPSWVSWNNSGYEVKDAYPEYRHLLDQVGSLPPGRLQWERLNGINQYGSDFALMLLPYFTDGRIDSMEGLYFESSATTPYHFMTESLLAKEPSNPVRGIPYGTLAVGFPEGVRRMQALGVRYYMAGSSEAQAAADADPRLTLVREVRSPFPVARVANWRIYEVADADLVEGLEYEPVVLEGVSEHDWLGPSSRWFDDEDALDRPLAAGGPRGWVRSGPDAAAAVERKALPEVKVSRVRSGDDSISFRVDRVGVPVLVKVSYFPNWQASGAKGPWRVTPNLMVVVPTARSVELHYGRTPVDWAGLALTLGGFAGLLGLQRWRPTPIRHEQRWTTAGAPGSPPAPTDPATAADEPDDLAEPGAGDASR